MQTRSMIKRTQKPVYAGIGSRKTPVEILSLMENIGQTLAKLGWVLRTGNCQGTDQAFQRGANSVNPRLVELYLPWPSYEAQAVKPGNTVHTSGKLAYREAARHHPAWPSCGQGARAMHARNTEVVLGHGLDRPVELLVCWTPGGQAAGGTGQGIRVALAYEVLVVNLASQSGIQFVQKLSGVFPKVSSTQAQFIW